MGQAFTYTAIDDNGRQQNGVLEGLSQESITRELRNKGLFVMDMEEYFGGPRKTRFSLSQIRLGGTNTDRTSIIVFFRELATLVDAGIQLADSLTILREQIESKYFRGVIDDVSQLVQSGAHFSTALGEHPEVFSNLIVSMVQTAELSGELDEILSQLASYIENQEQVRQKIKSASSYPKFILSFFSLVLGGVVFGLVPKFKEIFEGFGAELPALTLGLLSVSEFIKGHIIAEAFTAAALVVGFKLFKKSPTGKIFIHTNIFHVPFVGNLIRKSVLSRVARTLSVLLRSGVNLVDGLKIASRTADNIHIEQTIHEIGEAVTQGRSFGSQLARFPVYPSMMVKMIAIGERSGALTTMLEKIAEFYEQEFKGQIDGLASIIEPLLMVVLGLLATVLVLALYLPIFQMTGSI